MRGFVRPNAVMRMIRLHAMMYKSAVVSGKRYTVRINTSSKL